MSDCVYVYALLSLCLGTLALPLPVSPSFCLTVLPRFIGGPIENETQVWHGLSLIIIP